MSERKERLFPAVRPGRRVLILGDSHTVGQYGKILDQACRDAGARVRTYASCSSHPIWWFDGTRTHCGYFSRNERGQIVRVPFGQLKRTPRLPLLFKQCEPELVIVSLGANMVDYSRETVMGTSAKMAQYIAEAGAELIWVGPPVIRLQPRWKLDRLCGWLHTAVKPWARFIDARPYTYYPETGGDGIHFKGAEGRKIAKDWAQAVFAQIQGSDSDPLRTSGNP